VVVIAGSVGSIALLTVHVNNKVEFNSRKYPITNSDGAAPGYLRLFNDTGKVHDVQTMSIKGRHPVVDFAYGDDYFVEISKLNCNEPGPLDSLITVDMAHAEMSMSVIFTSPPNSGLPFTTSYAHRKQDSSNHVFVTLNGKVRQSTKNDSTLVYLIALKDLGLKYNPERKQDIYIRREKKEPRAYRVIFARRQGGIYLVLIAGKNESVDSRSSFAEGVFK